MKQEILGILPTLSVCPLEALNAVYEKTFGNFTI